MRVNWSTAPAGHNPWKQRCGTDFGQAQRWHVGTCSAAAPRFLNVPASASKHAVGMQAAPQNTIWLC
jgi:hypothetical protein